MLPSIYLILLAISDIAIPTFAIEIVTSQKVKLERYIVVYLAFFFVMFREMVDLNYLFAELLLYMMTLLYVDNKQGKLPMLKCFLFFFVTNYAMILFINFVSYILFYNVLDTTFTMNGLFVNERFEFIYKLLYILFLLSIKIKRIAIDDSFTKRYWKYVFLFMLLSSLSVISFMVISYYNQDEQVGMIYSFLAAVTICIFYIFHTFFATFYDNYMEKQKLKQEKEHAVLELHALIEEQKSVEKIKKFKHDIQNNFIILHHMMKEEKYQEAIVYLEKYIDKYEEASRSLQIDNIVAAAIINDKIKRYPSLTFDVKTFLPKYLHIDSIDFGIILGNIIDNACEYCFRIQSKNAIHIHIYTYYDTNLFIEVKNEYRESEVNLITIKEDSYMHGYGLQNTKEVVEKYDGYHHIKIEDGMFITQILLPEVGKERIE